MIIIDGLDAHDKSIISISIRQKSNIFSGAQLQGVSLLGKENIKKCTPQTSSISSFATLLTGETSDKHRIFASKWINNRG